MHANVRQRFDVSSSPSLRLAWLSTTITPLTIKHHRSQHRHPRLILRRNVPTVASSPRYILPSSPTSCLHPVKPPTKSPLLSRQQIPNLLTYARVAAIPILTLLAVLPPFNAQATLLSLTFASASLTDLLDGYLARKWNVVSPMGIFLDPVADKLIVAVALIYLAVHFPTVPVILSVIVTILREIFVSALREWMAIRRKSAVVKVSVFGKVKTASQMLSISILLSLTYLDTWYARMAILLLVLSSVLAVFSAVDYIRASISSLRQPLSDGANTN